MKLIPCATIPHYYVYLFVREKELNFQTPKSYVLIQSS